MSDTATIDAIDTTATVDTSTPQTPATPAAVVDTTQTPQATAPVYFNADGSLGKDWHLGLGDEFAPYASQLATFKDVKGLAKSYVHLRASGPAYPTDASTPEEVSRFRQLAQVPESPDGYGLTPPENLPEGVVWDDAMSKSFAELAHKHHVPAGAVKAIADLQVQIETDRAQKLQDTMKNIRQEAENALVAEWRGNFEQNKSVVRHLAGRLAESAGIPADDPIFAEIVNVPAFAKIMLQVSKLTAEDAVRVPGGFGDLRSPQQRANEIMNGGDKEWGSKYQDGDKQAMALVSDLLKQAAG